ncbi:unnamed protein product [Candida parapsilosis]|uniref:Uncharacterized protein n=1 Tax=Candida parapsilosis (strain CDC 317 / ATCC MYA-4646) TaxID=578454 RepID=G8BEG6_CANPC|nr:uncharacterized protein CPAR2_213060 [Candida parapsilosis]CAD1809203.1 unnamed protein product [Candida parapsilosis]CCE43663.1 hypothetical protein CPAR2_213060 [Candida parapsilosis]
MKSQIGLATIALGTALFSYRLFLQTHEKSESPTMKPKHKFYTDFDKEYDAYKLEIDNQVDF